MGLPLIIRTSAARHCRYVGIARLGLPRWTPFKAVFPALGCQPVRRTLAGPARGPEEHEQTLRAARAAKRDQLLAQTPSSWERLRIRIKWALARSTKPFNSDDISAFVSWILVSHALLIILGTTTFASLVIYLMNTVLAQEYVATQVGNFLTKNTALTVVFENAIVPDWSSGKITFNKVFVSRRPKQLQGFSKGSQHEAVERAKLALSERLLVSGEEFDDGNYTQFDLTIDQVEISLNFGKWINGKGILDEVTINGLRGVVDRTHVMWKDGDDPRKYLNVHQPGDFEISTFRMNDVLFTLYQPGRFRPFQVSVFNCELPQLRKHWLFFDILNAHSMSGTYDNAMFMIHRRYKEDQSSESPLWRKFTRMRVDNLNVDHLNAGMKGPFGWITSGKVDMIGDILLPEEGLDGSDLSDMLAIIGDRLLKEARRHSDILPFQMPDPGDIDPHNYFVMDFFLRLHNVRAEVPLFTPELSYINNALIRPIVGYINSKRSYIPIQCRVVKNLADFEGSWTIYDSKLMDDLSAEVYDAFADYVADQERKNLRMKRVGFWSLHIIIQLILMSLGAIA
ncbi:ABL066Cp [Eremothecium gossypii ATCC 10895]|uniref:ABL066Cp n=1 Tax=Eremothecium gossypii (strain ATCC 10895 / CBS 109.51 / FGSC 9923 / NRRL Y-1056) TaxID=284811 RepID=Q75DT9_EREGS|nr:ABL066Cp [Eremothecium gossypii ATCC 10895]AAS50705.1 ABL066Cp [Eremothecium gossypii ATCC 10895]AEY94993.1 FABL066Cp [Eremothecium gossypii FDAG1]